MAAIRRACARLSNGAVCVRVSDYLSFRCLNRQVRPQIIAKLKTLFDWAETKAHRKRI